MPQAVRVRRRRRSRQGAFATGAVGVGWARRRADDRAGGLRAGLGLRRRCCNGRGSHNGRDRCRCRCGRPRGAHGCCHGRCGGWWCLQWSRKKAFVLDASNDASAAWLAAVTALFSSLTAGTGLWTAAAFRRLYLGGRHVGGSGAAEGLDLTMPHVAIMQCILCSHTFRPRECLWRTRKRK